MMNPGRHNFDSRNIWIILHNILAPTQQAQCLYRSIVDSSHAFREVNTSLVIRQDVHHHDQAGRC